VQAYTRCNLTKSEDKLVAMSGLAKRVQSLLCDEYLAGLWRSNLPHDFLWRLDPRHHPSTRPALYRAPTWSWAIVETPIRFPGYLLGTEIVITILDCGVDLTLRDPTGQVTDGFICLRGSAIPSRISRRRGNQYENPEISLDLRNVKVKGTMIEDVTRNLPSRLYRFLPGLTSSSTRLSHETVSSSSSSLYVNTTKQNTSASSSWVLRYTVKIMMGIEAGSIGIGRLTSKQQH